MTRNWMEPPAWWVKYKPLRWVLGAVLLYWIFSTLLPRFKDDSPVTAEPAIPAEQPADPVTSAPTPTPPPAPVAPVEIKKPPPVAPTTPPKPAPVAKPEPVKPPPKPAPVPPPKPVPVAPTKPAPAVPKPASTPAPPVTKPAAPVETQAKPAPVTDPEARYTQVESERVALINGLRSYDSAETLRALLEKADYSVSASMIERPFSSRYPPFRTDTLVVSNYKHAEFEGKLTLEFFNDRLYQTYFEPAKAADYLRWLRSRGVALPVKRTGRSSLTQGHLSISTNIDFASSDVGSVMHAKPFVFWEDARLARQMKDWGPVR